MIFHKPLAAVTLEDLHQLIGVTAEGPDLEFKQDLDGDGATRWRRTSDLLENARDDLLKELVAFANSAGGTLILGIREKRGQGGPPIADALNPIPKPHQLLTRLEQQMSSAIEPRLSSYERHVVVAGSEDEGILLFRVPPSSSAAHRVNGKLNRFYKRRGEMSEPMAVYEITALMRDRLSGVERTTVWLAQRAANYRDWMAKQAEIARAQGFKQASYGMTYEQAAGFRCTAVPTTALSVPEITRKPDFRLWPLNVPVLADGKAGLLSNVFEPPRGDSWKPRLRSWYREQTCQQSKLTTHIGGDGLIEYQLREFGLPKSKVAGDQILGLFLTGLLTVSEFRKRSGFDTMELAMQWEIDMPDGWRAATYDSTPQISGGDSLGTPVQSFPYTLGPDETLQEVGEQIELDLWNAFSVVRPPHFRLRVADAQWW